MYVLTHSIRRFHLLSYMKYSHFDYYDMSIFSRYVVNPIIKNINFFVFDIISDYIFRDAKVKYSITRLMIRDEQDGNLFCN